MSNSTNVSQSAYQALIERIADDEPVGGWPRNVDLLKNAAPLSDEEMALVCSLHAQAVTDELSIDPTLLARHLRGEIDTASLLSHLREATETAVWKAVHSDVLEECERRNTQRWEARNDKLRSDAPWMTDRDRAEHACGVGSLF